jgi:hypothetical protein
MLYYLSHWKEKYEFILDFFFIIYTFYRNKKDINKNASLNISTVTIYFRPLGEIGYSILKSPRFGLFLKKFDLKKM